jgi:hypothetical protein
MTVDAAPGPPGPRMERRRGMQDGPGCPGLAAGASARQIRCVNLVRSGLPSSLVIERQPGVRFPSKLDPPRDTRAGGTLS